MELIKSKPCTTLKQSERLTNLGLKVETADFMWMLIDPKKGWSLYFLEEKYRTEDYIKSVKAVPAWSLDMLIGILAKYSSMGYIQVLQEMDYEYSRHRKSLYDVVINLIEKRIEEGTFNKNYLKNE